MEVVIRNRYPKHIIIAGIKLAIILLTRLRQKLDMCAWSAFNIGALRAMPGTRVIINDQKRGISILSIGLSGIGAFGTAGAVASSANTGVATRACFDSQDCGLSIHPEQNDMQQTRGDV